MNFEDENEKYDYYHALCPKCLGDDFENIEKPITYNVSMKNPNKYKCCNCGWEGFQNQFLPTNLENVKKLK